MFGLSLIDITAIAAYFSVTIFIGFKAMRNIKDQEDYFLAGRRFGKLIQTFASFGQGTSAESAVVMARMTFVNGAAAIWQALTWVFGMPVFWFTSVWYRRLRIISLGDFFEERYGSKFMAAFYAVVSAVFFVIVVGLGFHAMSTTICAIASKPLQDLSIQERQEYDLAIELEQLENADFAVLNPDQQERLSELRELQPRKLFSHINSDILIWLVAAVVLIYAIAGGLEAAFITDMIQGIFIIILSFILLPSAFIKINALHGSSGILGAFQTMHQVLPASFFVIWGSPTLIDLTWYYIVAITIMYMINVAVQANQLTACGAAKDEFTARVGFVSGMFIKRFCTLLWGITGMAALVLYKSTIANPDYVWGHATRDLLGGLNIGLVGLMIACLMAALMSTADCLMITASSLLTHNFYRVIFPSKSERHYVFIGRILGGGVVIGAAITATQFQNVWQMFKLIIEFNVILAASFWLGMRWRRANRIGAWSSMIVTLFLTALLPFFLPILMPSLRTNQYLLKTTQSRIIERVYMAREMDVLERQKEIDNWDHLQTMAKATGARPLPIKEGEKFNKTYQLPQKSIFWTQDIETKRGQKKGSGMLNFDLVIIDKLGFDLSKQSYALNETLRVVIRTVIPFVVLIIVSLFTTPDNKQRLDRFFAKTHTPVSHDYEVDARELAISMENPERLNHCKMFPGSCWEFEKWDKVDMIGFLLCVLGSAAIIVLLKFIVSLGA